MSFSKVRGEFLTTSSLPYPPNKPLSNPIGTSAADDLPSGRCNCPVPCGQMGQGGVTGGKSEGALSRLEQHNAFPNFCDIDTSSSILSDIKVTMHCTIISGRGNLAHLLHDISNYSHTSDPRVIKSKSHFLVISFLHHSHTLAINFLFDIAQPLSLIV